MMNLQNKETTTNVSSTTSSDKSVDKSESKASRRRTKKKATPRGSEKIRSTLLHKLGIDLARSLDIYDHMIHPPNAPRPQTTLLRDVVPFQEPLKYNEEEDADSVESEEVEKHSSSWSSTGTAKTASSELSKPSKKGITFDDNVAVVPIPERSEYSDRVKTRLWSGGNEIYENAQRNALEFAAEGWNWRQVTEDDDMYVCSMTGELVHPVHCDNGAFN